MGLFQILYVMRFGICISATSSTMPAVYTFAVYSTIAVTLDFVFQMTAFVAILAIDEDRYRVSFDQI